MSPILLLLRYTLVEFSTNLYTTCIYVSSICPLVHMHVYNYVCICRHVKTYICIFVRVCTHVCSLASLCVHVACTYMSVRACIRVVTYRVSILYSDSN